MANGRAGSGAAAPAVSVRLGPLLQRHGIRPRKSLGQHFLADPGVLATIVDAADLRPGDRVLEIGCGVGNLTRALALAGAVVRGIEIDRRLEPALREMVTGLPVDVTWGDALRTPLPGADKVVANLPYQITGPLVARLLATEAWERLILMMQREVAARVMAPPGGRDYGAFTLLVRYHARAERVVDVARGAFVPPPAVDSTVLRLWPAPPRYPRAAFFTVVRRAFAQRRKMLANALGDAAVVARAGIDGRRRGETLTLEEFGCLAEVWESAHPSPNGHLAPERR